MGKRKKKQKVYAVGEVYWYTTDSSKSVFIECEVIYSGANLVLFRLNQPSDNLISYRQGFVENNKFIKF